MFGFTLLLFCSLSLTQDRSSILLTPLSPSPRPAGSARGLGSVPYLSHVCPSQARPGARGLVSCYIAVNCTRLPALPARPSHLYSKGTCRLFFFYFLFFYFFRVVCLVLGFACRSGECPEQLIPRVRRCQNDSKESFHRGLRKKQKSATDEESEQGIKCGRGRQKKEKKKRACFLFPSLAASDDKCCLCQTVGAMPWLTPDSRKKKGSLCSDCIGM